jgi:transposase
MPTRPSQRCSDGGRPGGEQANLLALFWEGFEPVQHTHVDSQTLTIRLQAKAAPVPVCSHCGWQVSQIHDVHWRQVRERDLFSYRVWLEVPVRRLRCPDCGPSREQIPWLAGRRARQVIKRMAYGDRDADYFFLKIKAAFPGKAR